MAWHPSKPGKCSLFALKVAIDVFPVPDPYDRDDAHGRRDLVDDSIIRDADSITMIVSSNRFTAWRKWILFQ